MRGRLLGGIVIVVLVVVVGVVFVLIGRNATPVSQVETPNRPCVDAGQACLRFPTITGDNLLGEALTLPDDFASAATLVIVPFDEAQQVGAGSWLPAARDLAASHPDFGYYNVPVFPSMAAAMRGLIRAGMSLTIGDEALRAITVTVFLDDRDAFLTSLNIANTDAMPVFLLNAEREVVWRGMGEYTAEQGAALQAALAP